jgi:cytochrome c oxidase subunit 3
MDTVKKRKIHGTLFYILLRRKRRPTVAEIDRKASQLISKIEPARPAATNQYVGMIFFLVSEAFLFGGLFWTYYFLRAASNIWPPEGVELNLSLAITNTIILLLSSATIQLAAAAIRRNNQAGLTAGILATLLLGATFLIITGWEWVHEPFRPWSHAYGSIFYTLTGFHALHVFGGALLMLFLLIRTLRKRFSASKYLAVEVGSLYWHFVDFIWLIVFSTLFIVK